LLIVLGVLAGRVLKVDKEMVGKLLIYVIYPVMVFQSIGTMELNWQLFLLTPFFFVIGVVFCLIFLVIGKMFFRDSTANLLAFGAGMGNTGYFGFPLVRALFSDAVFPAALLIDIGMGIYQHSVGAFVAAKGNRTVRESVMTVLKLPPIYAMLAAIAWNAAGFGLPAPLNELGLQMRGAYVALGMMLVGIGLCARTTEGTDFRYLSLVFFAKFLVWPAAMLGIIWIDANVTQVFSTPVHQVMLAQSIVPVAANVVAYAAAFRLHPAKAANAVFASTVFAFIYVPLAAMILF
jgi:predicted permease